MNYNVVIFGASSGGKKVVQTLENLNYSVEYLLDNNSEKWGQKLEEKMIYNPDILYEKKDNYKIVIASEYQKEIEQQLIEMNVYDKLILKEELIHNYIKINMDSFAYLKSMKPKLQEKRSIIIDLAEGYTLGGIEEWSLFLAKELKDIQEDVWIYSRRTDTPLPENMDRVMEYFDMEYYRYKENMKELADSLLSKLPCVVIINKHTQLQFAANIVKYFYPESIKIVSIIHSDSFPNYRRQVYLEKYYDAILCVSKKVRDTMETKYKISRSKLYYKESPVNYENIYNKTYSLNTEERIKIGYAARLEKSEKRADLLIPFIENLDKLGINYSLEIAGDGQMLEMLKEQVNVMEVDKKIKFLGRLPKWEMEEFWKKKDIFVNFSDCEGIGLSMLEAMSWGTVPIETCVAGSDEFIFEGYNGFVCELRDVARMAEAVYELYRDREKIKLYGGRCRKIIKKKCLKGDYIKYMIQLFDSLFL